MVLGIVCQVLALWPSIRCRLYSSNYNVRDRREITCWERDKDPQEEEGQLTVNDDEGVTQRHFLLQALLVLGLTCMAGRMQFLLLPGFDPFAKLSVSVVVRNPYLSSSIWHWRGAGVDLFTFSGLVLGDCFIVHAAQLQRTVKEDEGATQRHFLQAFLVLRSICMAGRMQFLLLPEFDSFAKLSVAAHNPYLSSSSWHWRAAGLDHDVQEFNEELVSWELDPQEEEVQHAGQDNGGTIHRYDAMVRREWVPLLQACLVFGSICTAGLLQLLLLPVFDPCANFRVVDHNLPSSIWHWCAAGFDLLSPDLHWLGTWRSPHWLHSDIEPCQYLQ